MGVINYIKDVKGEMKHVSWATRKQTVNFTVLIIIISILTAYFLGTFDFIFTKLIDILIT